MTTAADGPARVGDVLLKAADYLKGKGRESPRLGAEILLARTLGCDRVSVYLRFEDTLSPEQLNQYRDLIRRRGQGEPVAYLTGEKEFHSMKFRVAPGVLIPRPETETLVEAAVEEIRARQLHRPRVLDLGVGSGNVLIAVAKEIEEATFVGVDVSPGALQLARENIDALCPDTEISLLQGRWFEPLGSPEEEFDAILSNPPYIRSDELERLPPEISIYEPRMALDGGDDGLAAYREIAGQADAYLRPGGFIALEVGDGQSEAVAGMFIPIGYRTRACQDLTGRNRVILLEKGG